MHAGYRYVSAFKKTKKYVNCVEQKAYRGEYDKSPRCGAASLDKLYNTENRGNKIKSQGQFKKESHNKNYLF